MRFCIRFHIPAAIGAWVLSLCGSLFWVETAGAFIQSERPTRDLIKNGDFADVQNGVPTGWVQSNWNGDARFAVDSEVGHQGKPSVRINSDAGADASWSYRIQVKPRTDYRFTAWIKTEGVQTQGGLGVLLNVHELQKEGKSTALVNSADWIQVRTEFNSGNHESLLLNLLFGGWGQATGTAWFDDVQLEEIASDVPTMSVAEAAEFFDQQILPILSERCFKCHGEDPDDLSGELALTDDRHILKGGESGPAVDLSSPETSLILEAINYETFEMPPDGKLPDQQIELLTRWVKMGIPWGTKLEIANHIGGDAESKPTGGPEVNEVNKRWWSFQPVANPQPPNVTDAQWCHNELDQFILAKLEARGLRPSPPASRAALIRRAYYDLIGLPPTPAEVEAFVADPRPDAFARVVDRLLDSPHYGEKWGRHWLDCVRYAESNSFERDGTKPFVWRYRDYVIRSFNNDKPYDQFLLEQLAGDEIEPVTTESLIATGYYRLGQWDDEPADPLQAKFDDLDDILATTCQTMLGLTVNCARCHDHKIDPIPQRDYYSMLSMFSNIRRYGIRAEETVLDASVRTLGSPASDEEMARYQSEMDAVQATIDDIERRVKSDFIPVEFEEFQYAQNRVHLVGLRVGRSINEEEFAAYQAAVSRLSELKNNPPAGELKVLCVKESGKDLPEANVLIRGNPHVKGDPVQPGFLSILSAPVPKIVPPASGQSCGGRLAFANWVIDPENPMTSRVMVNRLWQHHFGHGIVRTSSDFGFQGSPPSHPELLDWLAHQLVVGGWRIKPLHRMIMLSAAYQMSNQFDSAAYQADPMNDLFWRFDIRRLSAEEIRDSMLAVTGSLNLESMYGPSIFTELAPEVLAGQSRPGDGWGTSSESDRRRRSIYIHVKRSLKDPLLLNHDMADTDFSCPVRFITTQPTQALGLMNGNFANRQAEVLAEKVQRLSLEGRAQQVAYILRHVTQRPPSADEIQRGGQFIDDLVQTHQLSESDAVRCFCLLALNLNEFVYLD